MLPEPTILIPVKLKISYELVDATETTPPGYFTVLETPLRFIVVQAYPVAVWIATTVKLIVRLSKELSVGIPVTLRVIAPVGFVQIATLPPPVL